MMKFLLSLLILSCGLLEARGYPHPYFTSSGNFDTWSYGGGRHGGIVLTRSHDPYQRAVRGGPTTYALRQPETEVSLQQANQYHLADRRRQALLEVNNTPPQQNEVYYPELPESPAVIPIDSTELAEPIEQADVTPTTKSVSVSDGDEHVPEIKDKEESTEKPKKSIHDVKDLKRPVVDEDEDEDESYPNQPKLPIGGYFPMFFGWGGASGSGGPIAIANSYGSGRGGAAVSHAVAYGIPKPVEKP